MTTITILPLDKIRTDGGTQPRADFIPEAVRDYTDAMRDGAEFPPVVIYFDGENHWLADGFHRLRSSREVGYFDIRAEVRQGTQRDAILHSVGANAAHGLRRTNADKQRAVKKLLEDAEWVKLSDSEIARRCGVSHPFVGALRADLTCNGYKSPAERTGADGRTINTANIGRKPSAPPPAAPSISSRPTPPPERSAASPPPISVSATPPPSSPNDVLRPAPATVGDAVPGTTNEEPILPPLTVNLDNDAFVGKTAALRAAGSHWGNPDESSPVPATATSSPSASKQLYLGPMVPLACTPHQQALRNLEEARELLADVGDKNLRYHLNRAVAFVTKLVESKK